MPIFRQVYSVSVPLGHRLRVLLFEAASQQEARLAALGLIHPKNTGLDVELRGEPEPVELPADWVIRETVT